ESRTEAVLLDTSNGSRAAREEALRRNQVLSPERCHVTNTSSGREDYPAPGLEIVGLRDLPDEPDVGSERFRREFNTGRRKQSPGGVGRVVAAVPCRGSVETSDIDPDVEGGYEWIRWLGIECTVLLERIRVRQFEMLGET